jgi:hypothetical protein
MARRGVGENKLLEKFRLPPPYSRESLFVPVLSLSSSIP